MGRQQLAWCLIVTQRLAHRSFYLSFLHHFYFPIFALLRYLIIRKLLDDKLNQIMPDTRGSFSCSWLRNLLILLTPACVWPSCVVSRLCYAQVNRLGAAPYGTDSHTIIRREYFVKRNVLQELNASRAEIVIRLEEQVAVLLANQSQPTTRSTRPPHCTGRTIIGEATCLDSSPTTSLCDGYLGSHTGHRATPTTSPLGLHITASTDGDTFRPGSLQREKQSVESWSFKEKVYRSKLKFSSSNPIVGI
ncbi:hypothetical protein J6590_015866 [Homalodisca vitripennis]|nr:hypothetical protein J6590_015866 [Homalodisca vitripennis]